VLAGAMKYLALAVLAIGLGCSVAAAETLTESLQSDTAGLYAAIKEAMQSSYVNGSIKKAIKEKRYVLDDCEAPNLTGSGPSKSELLDSLAGVAGTAVRLSVDLRKLGYPPEVWEPLIQDFELREIESIRSAPAGELTEDEKTAFDAKATDDTNKLYKGLVAALSGYREAHPSLVRAVFEDSGCGVGEEVEVTIKTRPSGGTVYFISSFDYKLCKARNLDPENRDGCNLWQEAVEGAPAHMLGDYEYFATWQDRAPKRSRLRINSSSNWQQTITITP
jgi:hypothetical protein